MRQPMHGPQKEYEREGPDDKSFSHNNEKIAIPAIITYDSLSQAHNAEGRNNRGSFLFLLNAFRRLCA